MKNTLLLLAACIVGAAVYVSYFPAASYETEVVKAEIDETGPQAQAALAQYPETTPRVFVLYGQTPEFAEVMRKFGHNQTVPIIQKCLEGGDAFLEMGSQFDQIASAVWNLKWPETKSLTPVECGWRAILITLAAGNDFLGQFVIDDAGEAHRLPGSTVLATIKDLTTSGLQVLERKLVLGESVSWQEWGSAVLDVAVIGASAKSVSLIVRGRLAAQAAKPALGARLSAARSGLVGFAKAAAPRVAKYATIAGVGYIAIYHPALITAAARTVAEILGLNPLLVQIIVWGAILFFPLWFLISFLSVLRWALFPLRMVRRT